MIHWAMCDTMHFCDGCGISYTLSLTMPQMAATLNELGPERSINEYQGKAEKKSFVDVNFASDLPVAHAIMSTSIQAQTGFLRLPAGKKTIPNEDTARTKI